MSEENEEESAIDVIYQLQKDSEYIKKYIQLIDNNLKLIFNKLNKIEEKIDSQEYSISSPKITATPGTPAPKQSKSAKKAVSDRLVLGATKVFGYIKNKNHQPIPDVEINVYDEKGEVIKKRKSDSDGYWDVRLPVGKYGVEYIQSGFRPINRTIEVSKSMKTFEVT